MLPVSRKKPRVSLERLSRKTHNESRQIIFKSRIRIRGVSDLCSALCARIRNAPDHMLSLDELSLLDTMLYEVLYVRRQRGIPEHWWLLRDLGV